MGTFYLSPDKVRYYPRRAFTYNNLQYNSQTATHELFVSLGFTEVNIEPRPDDKYYFVSGPDDTGAYTSTPRDLEELKASEVEAIKEQANAILRGTDWQVVRAIEDPAKPVPAAVENYRTAVRAASNAQEAAIYACTTVEELAALAPASWPDEPAES